MNLEDMCYSELLTKRAKIEKKLYTEEKAKRRDHLIAKLQDLNGEIIERILYTNGPEFL